MKLITEAIPDPNDEDLGTIHLSDLIGVSAPLCGDSCHYGCRDAAVPYEYMGYVGCARRYVDMFPSVPRVECANNCGVLQNPFFFADYVIALAHWQDPEHRAILGLAELDTTTSHSEVTD